MFSEISLFKFKLITFLFPNQFYCFLPSLSPLRRWSTNKKPGCLFNSTSTHLSLSLHLTASVDCLIAWICWQACTCTHTHMHRCIDACLWMSWNFCLRFKCDFMQNQRSATRKHQQRASKQAINQLTNTYCIVQSTKSHTYAHTNTHTLA